LTQFLTGKVHTVFSIHRVPWRWASNKSGTVIVAISRDKAKIITW